MYTTFPLRWAVVTTQILLVRVVSLITTQLAVEVGLQTFPGLSCDTYRTRDNSTRFCHLLATLLTMNHIAICRYNCVCVSQRE
jgi:hypothetical protein